MAVTVQMQLESAVTEMYQDAFVGSSIEHGATMITFDLRQHNFQQELGATATLAWRKEAYHVESIGKSVRPGKTGQRELEVAMPS